MNWASGLMATDLLATLVTSAVFLAGFSSLRIHNTVGEKKRRLGEVVSSVTTTPGFAAMQQRLNDELGQRASHGKPLDAARQLDAWLYEHQDMALTDRDLRSVADEFPSAVLREVDPIAWRTLLAVAGFTLGIAALTVTAAVPSALDGRLLSAPVFAGIVSFVAAAAVLTVAWMDYRSVQDDYRIHQQALHLVGLTATIWHPATDVDSASVTGGTAPVESQWVLTRSLLQVPGDSLAPTWDSAASDSKNLTTAARLVPEWSTPWQTAAYRTWQETQFLASDPRTASSPMRRHGLANAWRATQLNPLDSGCRILAAALSIDQLAAELFVLQAQSSPVAVDAYMKELPLSDPLSRSEGSDSSRVYRWRISGALRTAREAAILVELHWLRIRGLRAASGRLTELDAIATNYQSGRGYVLSAMNDPDSAFSRNNAKSAVKRLESVVRALGGLDELVCSAGKGPLDLDPLRAAYPGPATRFLPQPLCLPMEDPADPGRVSAEVEWWFEKACWLRDRPPGEGLMSTGEGILSFANPWCGP